MEIKRKTPVYWQAERMRRGPRWRWDYASSRTKTVKNLDHGTALSQVMCYCGADPMDFEYEFESNPERVIDMEDIHRIYSDNRLRLLLELEMMAGLSAEDISNKSGLSPKTIVDYSHVFFDVIDRHSARSWLMIGLGLKCTKLSNAERYAYKRVYFGGPFLVDPTIRGLDELGQSHDLSTSNGWMSAAFEMLVLAESLSFEEDNEFMMLLLKTGKHLPSPPTDRTKSVATLVGKQIKKTLSDKVNPNHLKALITKETSGSASFVSQPSFWKGLKVG